MSRQFMALAAKRIIDSRPLHAMLVVTDDCNLTCAYCDEYQWRRLRMLAEQAAFKVQIRCRSGRRRGSVSPR